MSSLDLRSCCKDFKTDDVMVTSQGGPTPITSRLDVLRNTYFYQIRCQHCGFSASGNGFSDSLGILRAVVRSHNVFRSSRYQISWPY